MKRIAITGATGFIGTAICRQLRKDGYQLRVLARDRQRAVAMHGGDTEIVSGDLQDRKALQTLVSGVDAVVHCAGAVRGATREQFDVVNVEGLRNLLQAMTASQPSPRLLALSSLAAREPELSFYSGSKYRGEQVLLHEAGHLDWIAVRPPAVYGPGERELLPLFRMMGRGFAPIPGDARARFSMLFVDDLARLVAVWLNSDCPENGVYTIHDGRDGGYSWMDVVQTVAVLCQRKVWPLRVSPLWLALPARVNRLLGKWFGYAPMLTPEKLNELRHRDWVCDNEAIERLLGWKPSTQLAEGLKQTPGWCPRLR